MDHSPEYPAVSVVVPCRGHTDELVSCLRSLMEQSITSAYEIIVVDSAADPAVANIVATFPSIILVRSQLGLNSYEARNLGVRQARGRYLAFTDADCIPESGWLAAATAALTRGAKVVGGPVLDAHPLHPIAIADNLLQFVDFPGARPDGAASYFPACNLALGRAEFHELGGFPTIAPSGGDVLCCGAAARRWPGGLRFLKGMRVRHTGRKHLRSFWKHHEVFGFYRGLLGLRLRPVYQRLGVRSMLVVPIACKRLSYIIFRTARWNPVRLPSIIFLLPILFFGLAAWTRGFRGGCREAARESR